MKVPQLWPRQTSCYTSAHHVFLREMVSSWYIPTQPALQAGLTSTTSCPFSSPDCWFISQLSQGHDYTLQCWKALFFPETSWIKTPHWRPRKTQLSGTNTLCIRSIILKCQRGICSGALWCFWWSGLFPTCSFCQLSSFIIQRLVVSAVRVIVSVVWLVKIRDLHR